MNRLNLIMMALALVLSAKAEVKTLKVKVANPSSVERTAVPVVVPLAEQYSTALVKLGDKEIPCQLDDLNDDGVYDELSFLTDMKKKEKQTFTVVLSTEGEPRQYQNQTYGTSAYAIEEQKSRNISRLSLSLSLKRQIPTTTYIPTVP